MARPLRIEYPGAVYEITVRGNAGHAIFKNDQDRILFLKNLGKICERFEWVCYAYCLLDSEYQLLIETLTPNLSRGMREVNGVYTQAINRKYQQRGHIFEGRFQALLIEKEQYLSAIHRKLAILPVQHNLVKEPIDWLWSHYRGVMGKEWAPSWLSWKPFLASFAENTGEARRRYSSYVAENDYKPQQFIPKSRIVLGSDAFLEKVQKLNPGQIIVSKLLQYQNAKKSLTEYQLQFKTRNEAIKAAYKCGDFTLEQIGEHFQLHYSSVSRIAHLEPNA